MTVVGLRSQNARSQSVAARSQDPPALPSPAEGAVTF